MGSHRVLEAIALADCALEIDGRDLGDLFESAALALAEVMVDPATVREVVARIVEIRAEAVDLLLYDWLSELIYLKDRDGLLVVRTRIEIGGHGPYLMRAELHGEIIDRERMALRVDAKAVTFHQLACEPVGDGWRARVVVDV